MNQRVPQMFFKRVTTSAEAENLRVIRNKCREYMTRSTDHITPEQQEEWFKTAFRKYDLYIAYAINMVYVLLMLALGLCIKMKTSFF